MELPFDHDVSDHVELDLHVHFIAHYLIRVGQHVVLF